MPGYQFSFTRLSDCSVLICFFFHLAYSLNCLHPEGQPCFLKIIFIYSSIPLSISYNHLSLRVMGGCSRSRVTLGERRGAPWTDRQSITGLTHGGKQPFTLTFTPMGNFESPINLTCMSLVCGRKLEHTEKAHTGMGRTSKSTQKPGFYQPNWQVDQRVEIDLSMTLKKTA